MIKLIKRNIFTIITALLILYLSLADSDTFDEIPVFDIPFLDKIVHFLMYFGLMSVIVLENRASIKNRSTLLRFTIFPFSYGIMMEILQLLTPNRSGNFLDALADTAGIIISILLWMLFKPLFSKQSDLY
jgi:VanZ family protein